MPRRRHDILDDLIADWGRERPDLDVTAMGIVGRIMHLGALLEIDANKVLKPFDLRYTDFDVLATLRRGGKPYQLTPTQLRRAVLITSGAMTACLDRLEKAGYIKRRPDPDDRRGTMVRMTRKGKTLVDKAMVPRFEVAAEAVAALSAAEAKRLSALLKKLTIAHAGL